jgi:hypothetical protein
MDVYQMDGVYMHLMNMAIAVINKVVYQKNCWLTCLGCLTRDGKRYGTGDSYGDECNNCVCQADGTFSCTAKVCAGK